MRTLRFVFGSILVYLFVACASAVMTQPSGSSNPDASAMMSATGTSTTSGGSSDGSSSTPGDSSSLMDAVDAVVDAVTNPVSTASADQPTSGTRLKAQWYVGTDGSRVQAGWYDSQLQVTCSLYMASDGTLRCLPIQAGVDTSAFSDSACTQPIVISTGCQPTYAYVLAPITGNACPPQDTWTIYQVGAQLSTYYALVETNFIDGGMTCTAGSASKTSNLTYYTLGAVVPPSTFVQATLQTDP